VLTFAYLWVFMLAPVPWLLRWLLPARNVAEVAVRVPFGDRLRLAMEEGSSAVNVVRRSGQHMLFALLRFLLLTAIARPQWLEPPVTRQLPTRDLLLLVDLSGSMQEQDFSNAAGVRVDRLVAVKEVLGDFLERRKGDRVGLVVFGDAPFLQAPFSVDLNLARELLNETAIGMAGPRTAFGDAIGLGITLFEQSEAPAKTIIALTDGNDTRSQVPPVEAARIASERGVRIHTVAIGDPTTVGEQKLDEEVLREVAETAGGAYFYAGDRQQLAGIYAELDKIETRQVNVASYRPRRDLFYWPVLLAVLLSVLEKALRTRVQARAATPSQGAGRIQVNPLTGQLELSA